MIKACTLQPWLLYLNHHVLFPFGGRARRCMEIEYLQKYRAESQGSGLCYLIPLSHVSHTEALV